ncbi:MAG: VOC family protein [Pseudomonadota bacterium]
MIPIQAADPAAPSGMSVGHVHLRVADLDRAVAFYRDVLGLDVMQRVASGAAFLSADGYHHHLGLNTWESLGGARPAPGTTGLYHVAFLYPDRASLARAVKRVIEAGVPIRGKADHGVSEAVYFEDPDGNGIELYRDRPRAEWPADAEGRLALTNAPLDLEALIAET